MKPQQISVFEFNQPIFMTMSKKDRF